jgi:hypothetical protein
MSTGTNKQKMGLGGEQPIGSLSPLDDEDIAILKENGVETVGDFLDRKDEMEVFLQEDELDAALTEAKAQQGDRAIADQARNAHSQWHDEMVKGGHDPVAEITDADDIKQPAGRPREDIPIEEQLPEIDSETLSTLTTAGYETGSDFNGVPPAHVTDETGLELETARHIVRECRTAYHGLPVLEDNGHPLIPNKDTYREIWTRRTLTGAKDVVEVCNGAATNEYPLLLAGYPGVGKSYLIAHICAMTNRPLMNIDMDSSLMAEDLLGFHVPADGNTVEFQYGLVPIAFRYGIWLNINEVPAADAGVWLALHQATERNPELFLRSTSEKITPHPAFRISGTKNPDTQDFAGHGQSNEASDSRWEQIWIDYLPKRDEVQLLDHMVNYGETIVSKHQLEKLVDWAERFRPGVPDPTTDPDNSPEEAEDFKSHVLHDDPTVGNNLPRLSTRDLAQICYKSAREGATLERSAVAVVFHLSDIERGELEAAMQAAKDL